VACHLLAYVEARAAFARKSREPGLEARLPQWRRGLEQDWEHFNVVEVSEGLVRRAGDLAEQYRLRGYDAVHLAAAESVMQLIGPAVPFRFAAFDGALVDAARVHGLPVL
jgi:predicted nucleic acid-binding protein